MMDAELFKTLGQWAGIGGIALGVFLILFREVIRKSVFPKLQEEKAYKLLRLITVFIWMVAVLGIGSWVWVGTNPKIQTGTSLKVEVDHGVGAGGDVNVKGDIIINEEKKKTKE